MGTTQLNPKKVQIIAEIANSHQGDPRKAYELAKQCFKAGADAVKFQIYFADELLVNSHSKYSHFKNQSFSINEWNNLFSKIKKINNNIYADIFGERAFEVAKKNKLKGIKIHSSDLTNKILIKKLKNNKIKYFISTGGSTLDEISYALKIFKLNKIKPILLHGYQAYPTEISDTNLNRIDKFKDIFGNNCDYGYQDHTSGDDFMNLILPQTAIGKGVTYIEKHVTLNRKDKGIDYYSSVEPKNLKKFIELVRNNELALGKTNLSFSKKEKKYRNVFKKIWVAKKNLKKNHKIKYEDLIMKRTNNLKINSFFIDEILGKKTIKNIKKDEIIKKSFFKNYITALIVSRSNSKRLKKKNLKKICEIPTIEHCIKRVKQSITINNIVLCTTKSKEDLKMKKIADRNKINFFAGQIDDVLKRMIDASSKFKTDLVIRVTGDDILIDPLYLDKTVKLHLEGNYNYTNNKKLPSGMEVEIFDLNVLKKIHYLMIDKNNTEYLTFYVKNNPDLFKTSTLNINKQKLQNISFTLDTKKDFVKINKFLNEMKDKNKLFNYKLDDVINFFKRNKSLFNRKINIKGLKVNTSLRWNKILNYQN